MFSRVILLGSQQKQFATALGIPWGNADGIDRGRA